MIFGGLAQFDVRGSGQDVPDRSGIVAGEAGTRFPSPGGSSTRIDGFEREWEDLGKRLDALRPTGETDDRGAGSCHQGVNAGVQSLAHTGWLCHSESVGLHTTLDLRERALQI